MATTKKVLHTIAKPLHGRDFAGMLPRIMSQGNDALVSKDAESGANAESKEDRSVNGSSSPAASGSDEKEPRRAAPKRHRDPSNEDSRKDADETRASDDAESDDDADQSEDDDSAQRDSEPDAETRKARPKQDRDEGRSSGEGRPRKSRRGQRRARDEDDDDRPAPPETEEAVNVPKMETVYMLGAMSVLTIILWFAARLSCNVHPDQVRDPKHFSTKDLAADPKNAAFEFQQRFETGDYTTSYDLATGELRRIVEGKLKECEQASDECAANLKKLAGSVESTPRVLEQTPNKANVEIQSYFHGSPTPKTFSFDVVKEGDFWRVASRREVANAPVQQVSPVPPGVGNPAAPTPGTANAAVPAAPMESPEAPAQQ